MSKAFGERAKTLGWSARPGEDEDTRLLRASLVSFVARDGDEPVLRDEARRLAEAWLTEKKRIDPDMLGSVLLGAAITGDRDFLRNSAND